MEFIYIYVYYKRVLSLYYLLPYHAAIHCIPFYLHFYRVPTSAVCHYLILPYGREHMKNELREVQKISKNMGQETEIRVGIDEINQN